MKVVNHVSTHQVLGLNQERLVFRKFAFYDLETTFNEFFSSFQVAKGYQNSGNNDLS